MSSFAPAKLRVDKWQVAVCGGVSAYVALSVATGTAHYYHWFLLVVVLPVLLAPAGTREFLWDWSPLFAFWLVYDRLRLVQPLLLGRVAVEWPYEVERATFGWLAGGVVPGHAARAWLAGRSSEPLWSASALILQVVYLSHIFVLPLLILLFWIRGRSDTRARSRFGRFMRAFLLLHAMGIATYLLLPVAPPWWVSLHGLAQPTAKLLVETRMTAAMDGAIVQGLIRNAAQWFAAVPSLHGAYPILMLLLTMRESGLGVMFAFVLYGAAMLVATVALNQHYIIDLIAGAIVALAAWWLEAAWHRRSRGEEA